MQIKTPAHGAPEAKSNPFTRRKFNTPTAQSPINEPVAKGAEPEAPEEQPEKEPIPVPEPEGETSDREDKGAEQVQLYPKDPTKRVYTDSEVLPLLDSLLQHGYALDSFKIRGTEIILRTRFTWEEQYIYQHLEACDIKSAINYQREYAFITLAASIVKYGDYVFEPINKGEQKVLEESITERYDFICSLNSVITDIIQLKLGAFDDKQRYIIAHFDDLLKAF